MTRQRFVNIQVEVRNGLCSLPPHLLRIYLQVWAQGVDVFFTVNAGGIFVPDHLSTLFPEVTRTEYGLGGDCFLVHATPSIISRCCLSEPFRSSGEFVPYSGILHLPDYLSLSRRP